jgi:histidyl-tRNA synthetase
MSGKKVPAFGFAAGVERLMLLAKLDLQKSRPIAVNYISENEKTYAFEMAQKLRCAGFVVEFVLDGNFKKQMKRASQNNSRFVVIIGEDEVKNGEVSVKDFDNSTEQKLKQELLVHYLEGKL